MQYLETLASRNRKMKWSIIRKDHNKEAGWIMKQGMICEKNILWIVINRCCNYWKNRIYMDALSEVREVLLLVFRWHAWSFCWFCISIKILCICCISNLWHPRRGYTSAHYRLPIHSSKPLMRFDIIGSRFLASKSHTSVSTKETLN
jgi:hypothetical protein